MSGLWKREMGLKYKFDNRPHVIPEALRSTQENRIMKAPAQGIAKTQPTAQDGILIIASY